MTSYTRVPWDTDVQGLVEAMHGTPPMKEGGVELARRRLESILAPAGPDMASVETHTIAGPHGPFEARIYRPLTAPLVDAPALVWFHGGGMIMGSLASFDRLAREVAAASHAVIVNVEYHLAPEYQFPVANDDAYAAICWVHDHAQELGVSTGKIGVGGDSAGGGLAASTALRCRNLGGPALAQQVLIYPGVERSSDRPSMREFGDSPFLTITDIDWMKSLYLGEDPAHDDEYGVPALATRLDGLPPAIVVSAHGDPIRDGVEEYGRRLQESGVMTAIIRYPGLGHGFFMQTAYVQRARTAMAEVGALTSARFALL